MAIRITRNEEGNCITFIGSSNPAYWNACLSAELSDDADRFHIINDLRSANEQEIQYEFYNVEYTDFADADGNDFTGAQTAVDYINANANVIGLDGGVDMTGQEINFRLDQTSTSILSTTGSQWGVNSVKAVLETNGLISIHSIGEGIPTGSEDVNEKKHYRNIDASDVSINGTLAAGGPQDVVNAMNALFTVGAFESVVISDPYSTMIADVDGTVAGYTLEGTGAVDPAGDDIFTNISTGNYAGLLSTATIDQAGEYYTFDIRGEGQIGFGLVHTQDSYDDGYYSGNSTYANPTTFATANSAHYGYQFSHWFHPTPNGSWTNYGASTGIVYGPGWYSWESQNEWLAGDPVKVKVGIDENGFIAISTLQDNNTDWILHARSSYPVAEGSEFRLGIKSANPAARVHTAPKVHLLAEVAPTMYFRWIESPDNNFEYPLFATEEEANYYDENHSGTTGTGTSHTHTYADDPTSTIWYMPTTGNTMTGTAAPAGLWLTDFGGVTYTEITSLTDADLTPSQFSSSDYSYQEGTVVNLQLFPAGATFTQSVSISPANSGLVYNSTSGYLQGTLTDVSSDTVYTVTVTRANAYGSNTGDFTITATDVAPAVPVSGFTLVTGSDPLVDTDTLASGSAVSVDDVVANNYRFKITDSYVTDNILPALTTTGDKVFIGFAPDLVNGWGQLGGSNFNCGFRFRYNGANSVKISAVLAGSSVGAEINHTYSSSIGLDFYLSNRNGVLEANYHSSSTNKDTELAAEDGGAWAYSETNSTGSTQARTVVIAADGPSATDFETTGLSEHVVPTAPATNSTSWTKALDFSGSSERAEMVSVSHYYSPMLMDYQSVITSAPSTAGNTSNDTSARPWATAVVFSPDGNNSNQHIWNIGEGAGSTDDNIYLRMDSSRNLYFGWGRDGALNEYYLARLSAGSWNGVYVGFNGTRLSGANATTTNLDATFDIRLMFNTGNSTWGFNPNPTAQGWGTWSTSGGRMDRSVTGSMNIGGRGTNRSFHGKVASFVTTTLERNHAMPDSTEIEMMITDPVGWLNDYKVGNDYRPSHDGTSLQNFLLNNQTAASATHVYLMGDGTSDSYSNMIRNQVRPADQNYTKLNLLSMQSNDIQNVSISGLS